MQQIWLDKSDGNESLKSLTLKMEQLSQYEKIKKFPYNMMDPLYPSAIIEFHGFSVASENTYAATLYIRVLIGAEIWSTLFL